MTRYITLISLAFCALVACNNASEQAPDNNDTQGPDEPVEEGIPQTLQAGQNFTGRTTFSYGSQGGSDDTDDSEPIKVTLCDTLVHAHTQAIVEVIDSEFFPVNTQCQGEYARHMMKVYVKVWAVAAGFELEHETYILDELHTGFGHRPEPGDQYLITARLVDGEWVRTSALYAGEDGFERRFEEYDPEDLEVPNDFDELHRQSTRILSDVATHCPDDIERQYSDEEWHLRLHSKAYWGCGIDDVEAGDPNRR